MRVAVLSQYPLNEERVVGGIEAVMVSLLPRLAAFEDLDLHVITCQGGVHDHQRSTWLGQPLHVCRRTRFGRVTFHARAVASIRRVLTEIRPDIVHAQGIGLYTLAALAYPCPHVATVHGIAFREAKFSRGLAGFLRGLLDKFYEKYCLARLKNLISINPYVEQELVNIGGFKGRVFSIPNPVDERFFGHRCQPASDDSAACGSDRVTVEAPIVLFSGKVIPRKALLILLQALVQVREKVPSVTLRVAGPTDVDREYFKTCQRFVAEHGLDGRVSFLGSLSLEEMVREYERCAVVAMPSEQETAPVAIAEAMAVGRPVVATRACGMPYMIEDGRSGLLVGYGDVSGWAEALGTVLANPGLRRAMGVRGYELAVARFHPRQVAEATRDAYYEILEQHAFCSS